MQGSMSDFYVCSQFSASQVQRHVLHAQQRHVSLKCERAFKEAAQLPPHHSLAAWQNGLNSEVT